MQFFDSAFIANVQQHALEYTLDIVLALVIFVVGRFIGQKLTKIATALMNKAHMQTTLVKFLSNALYSLILIAVVLTALSQLGINTTSLVAIFGAAGLAVGLALKDSFSNIGAAILILLFKPFKVGDYVEAGGAEGEVTDITLFSTTIAPIDNRTIIVPNAKVVNSNITNYSTKPTRRVTHTVGIGYDSDLKLAKKTLYEIIQDDTRILTEPEPLVAVSELADNSVNFTFRAWTKSEDYWSVHFDTLERIKLAFDEKGLAIPYPQIDVHLDTKEAQ